MTSREIFNSIVNFQTSKRTLNWEFGYWVPTIKRWYREGLPSTKPISEDADLDDDVLGPALPVSPPAYGGQVLIDYDVSNYFGFDQGFGKVPYDYWLFPAFEPEIIFEDSRVIELYDYDGVRKKKFKDGSSMPYWIEFPVETWDDWEEIKEERFNLDSITKRYLEGWDSFEKDAKDRTYPVAMLGGRVGFFGSIRFLLGEKRLYYYYYDNPELIKDMCNHLCKLWMAISEELISKIDFDAAVFWEDMSGKQGSLISPAVFKQFMAPYYRKLISFLKSKGISNFIVDTDGKVDQLIPLFLELGVNCMYPFEQQASNDLIKIRKEYPDLVIMGGFDKNTLYKGKSYIDKELEKMKWMISHGGYIPFADHLIPPNSTWENFKYYRERMKDIIFNTEVLS